MTDVPNDWLGGYKEAGLWCKGTPAISGPSPTYDVTCL